MSKMPSPYSADEVRPTRLRVDLDQLTDPHVEVAPTDYVRGGGDNGPGPAGVASAVSSYVRLGTAKPGDVGHDLTVLIPPYTMTWVDRLVSWFLGRRALVVWPVVGVRTIHSGIRVSMPNTIWAEVRPRSSTSRRKLHVLGGTIDSGYQGELYTVLHNLGLMPRLIKQGERYAQIVFHSAVRPMFERVFEFTAPTHRGDTGFGSTGR